jgi:adenylosuccinate synthase
VYGVVKAYTTRVGLGPFPTELKDETGAYLQKTGHEVGTTTGRARRCGWLDLPQLRYSQRVNGYSAINITKLDVLNGLPKIRVGTKYLLNGKELDHMPESLAQYQQVQVEYQELPGWNCSLEACRTWADLPPAAKAYVEFIAKALGVPVRWVGTGADRDNMITL